MPPDISDIRSNPKLGRRMNSPNADDAAIIVCIAKLAFAGHDLLP
jgi:hypothetical protein